MAFGITTFCDDIRFEQQNKVSLIGCYGPELLFHQKPPVVLPKLCAFVSVRLVPQTISSGRLCVYVPGQKEPHFISDVPKDQLDFALDPMQAKEFENQEIDPQRGMIFPLIFSPFVIQQEGYIKVRFTINSDEEIRLGALKIRYAGLASPQDSGGSSPPA